MAAPAQKKTRCERTILLSSESVNEGHTDKLCDQVSDAVLDTCLSQDPKSKVACDKATEGTMVKVAGLPPYMITPKFTVRRTKEEIKELEGPREDVVTENDSDTSRVTVSLEPFEDSQIPE